MSSENPYAGADEPAPEQPYGAYPTQPYPEGPSWDPDAAVRFGPAEPPTAPPPPAAPAEQPSRGTGTRTLVVAALVAALVGGGVGAGTATLVSDGKSGSASPGLSFSTQAAPAAKVDGTVSAAAAKIGPSVVTINVAGSGERDTGSGVIIRKDGYILTNNHVVSAAADGGTISVVLADGRSARAHIVGRDPSDDLAVIKIDLTGLTAATFASSSKLVVGQTVVAVGAPLGLSDTVTSGIVSSTARPVTTSDEQNDQAVFNAVQTDAAINPGNSGGPLVNLNGDVVGINAAIAPDPSQGGLLVPGQSTQSTNFGIGFAIPSDEASRIAGELISTGKATHAVLGVTVGDVESGSATANGAQVRSVTADGPAAKAGMKAGDVVTKVDSQLIDDATALVAAIRSHAPGQDVAVTYVRDGQPHTVSITLGTGDD